MTTYQAKIGEDRIAQLVDTESPIGRASLLDHVAAPDDQPDPDTMVFDDIVAAILRDLPEDTDGHLAESKIWFGDLAFPVEVQPQTRGADQ